MEQPCRCFRRFEAIDCELSDLKESLDKRGIDISSEVHKIVMDLFRLNQKATSRNYVTLRLHSALKDLDEFEREQPGDEKMWDELMKKRTEQKASARSSWFNIQLIAELLGSKDTCIL